MNMNHVRTAFDLRASGSPEHAMYGDTCGGRTFTNPESDMLEDASATRRIGADHGWREVWSAGVLWTVIDCRPASQRDRREYAEALASQ